MQKIQSTQKFALDGQLYTTFSRKSADFQLTTKTSRYMMWNGKNGSGRVYFPGSVCARKKATGQIPLA
jgi:hypothetical protein